MKIVGITGKAGSGKSSLAELYELKGFTKKAFADPIKYIAKQYIFWDGKKDKKGRKLLQTIGTEVGRVYDKDVWVKHMKEFIKRREMMEKHPRNKEEIKIIIDDVRFENEAKLIRDYGGKIIKLIGHAYDMGEMSNHASEQDIVGDIALNVPHMGTKRKFQDKCAQLLRVEKKKEKQ